MIPRTTVNGKTLSNRLWALLAESREAAGLRPNQARLVQGSWSGNVAASAGTHNGNGAFDLSVAGLSRSQQLRLVKELRKRKVAAWLRSPEFGWPSRLGGPHIHGILRDAYGLSWGAKSQVAAFRLGRNGLASKAKDPHYRPVSYKFIRPGGVKLWRLKYGRRNGHVRCLQRKLGIYMDGEYGPKTDKAVRDHQRLHDLLPTDRRGKSYVGPKQAKILGLG